jgi:hypothetical protein
MVPHECRRMRHPPVAAAVSFNEVGDGPRCISATDTEAHFGGPASHAAAVSLAAAVALQARFLKPMGPNAARRGPVLGRTHPVLQLIGWPARVENNSLRGFREAGFGTCIGSFAS